MEGLLLVDASNAFNSLSRPAALWNCHVLWPRCSRFLFNSYRGNPVILLKNLLSGKLLVLHSQEGTTQGCPLVMLMYAIGVPPLISRLQNPELHKQNWYADDTACAAPLSHIREWVVWLLEIGPLYGYFAEPSKSIVVVKEQHLQDAKAFFCDLQVEVVLAGRFLGGCVGNDSRSQARLTCGSGVLSCWPELPGPIHSRPMLHSRILSRASGRTFSRLWKAARKNIAVCVTSSIRSLPQLCAGERS